MLPFIYENVIKHVSPERYLDWVYETRQQRARGPLMAALGQNKFFIDIYEDRVREAPDRQFILFEDELYTYKQMDALANQAARAALDLGFKPGSIIAVFVYNEPAIVWTYLGFTKAGYQIALINFNLRARSLAHSVKASGATVLVVGEGEELEEAIAEILPDIPNIDVYQLGNGEHKPPFLPYMTTMSRMSTETLDRSVRKHVLPFTPSVFIYTSGTTGLPKPAIVPHIRMVAASFGLQAIELSADDVLYEPLPLYHSAGLLLGFCNVVASGASMVLKDKFSASQFWEDCRKHNVTIIQYIGEVCRYLVARPKFKDDGVHKIRYAFGNGLRADIWEEFRTRFKIPNIMEFYGATECPIALVNYTNKTGACGRSSPYLRQNTPVAFVKFDQETQKPARNQEGWCVPIGPDEVGLMIVPLIEGKTSYQGYRGRKEDTEKKRLLDVFVKGDQFFNTGDLMRVDKEYYVYFNDRVGDTFRWKGENVSTTEVSNSLTELKFIHDANVYGVLVPGGDGRAGMAAITLMDPTQATLSPTMLTALSRHVQHVLPNYARPKFLRIQKEFNMTSTFKQLKTSLVKEGFDMTTIQDPLFYLSPKTNEYLSLDPHAYTQIITGKITF